MADTRTAEIREETVSLGESMGDMKSTRFCWLCLTLHQSSNVNLTESIFSSLEMWSSVNLIPHAVFGADGEKKKRPLCEKAVATVALRSVSCHLWPPSSSTQTIFASQAGGRHTDSWGLSLRWTLVLAGPAGLLEDLTAIRVTEHVFTEECACHVGDSG